MFHICSWIIKLYNLYYVNLWPLSLPQSNNIWQNGMIFIFLSQMHFLKRNIIISVLFICLIGIFCKTDDYTDKASVDYQLSEIAEAANNAYNALLSSEAILSSPQNECRIPRQTNIVYSLRNYSQAKRNNGVTSFRTGFATTKPGKLMNPYATSLYFDSIRLFPSGLTEATHHLISLGKLII